MPLPHSQRNTISPRPVPSTSLLRPRIGRRRWPERDRGLPNGRTVLLPRNHLCDPWASELNAALGVGVPGMSTPLELQLFNYA